jgi:acetyl-CoA acyltransferase
MRRVDVIGTAVIPCGLYLDRSVKQMVAQASELVLADANIGQDDVEAIYFGNSLSGLITGQESARGAIACVAAGYGSIPIQNIENSCATGANAVHAGWLAVGAGLYDTVLVMGAEKVNLTDRARTFAAYSGGIDLDELFETGQGAGQDRTAAVDRQATLARGMMADLELTKEHFARLAAVSHFNASVNPIAHRQGGATWEQILADRVVTEPLTRLMMSPITDGAAAVVLSATRAGTHPTRVRIADSRVATRSKRADEDGPTANESVARAVYEGAGIGPEDVDVAEVHDASVAYQLISMREVGLCPPGDERKWIETQHTALTGALPVNTSGGLIARGHPIGATGVAQVVEITQQLRGEAGARQIANADARVGLAHVGGGVIGFKTAVAGATLLVKD